VPEAIFAIPGDLAAPTGGYAYDRRVLAELPACGVPARCLRLPASYPDPTADDLAETERLLAGTPENAVLLIDGLAYGALPPALVARVGRPTVALVHHPLGLETGLPPERAARLIEGERAALDQARRVVVTSPTTARLVADVLRVPGERIRVAEPGTDPAPRAVGGGGAVRLLAVGAVSPRKAYGLLIEALAGLADLDWRLTIAGALDRAPDETARLREAVRRAGLEGRVTLAGAVDDEALAALYARADAMVSPSLFEGYGMALAEALARGLPIVASTGGAAVDTAPDGAALKVPPGDVTALRGALRAMIADEGLRRACAEASWAAGQRLPRWRETARRIADVLQEIAP